MYIYIYICTYVYNIYIYILFYRERERLYIPPACSSSEDDETAPLASGVNRGQYLSRVVLGGENEDRQITRVKRTPHHPLVLGVP